MQHAFNTLLRSFVTFRPCTRALGFVLGNFLSSQGHDVAFVHIGRDPSSLCTDTGDWVLVVAHEVDCVREVNTISVQGMLTDALAWDITRQSFMFCKLYRILHVRSFRYKQQLTYDWLLMTKGCA